MKVTFSRNFPVYWEFDPFLKVLAIVTDQVNGRDLGTAVIGC